MRQSMGIRRKPSGEVISTSIDWETETFTMELGCVSQSFELGDIIGIRPYVIHEPKKGWKELSSFTDEEKQKLRPIAETLAMLDGNAFFGNTFPDKDQTLREWYEMYLVEAHALYEGHGGDTGWAGEASF